MDRTFTNKVHFYGRLWMTGALVLFFSIPITISIMLGMWPRPLDFLLGFSFTALIYWPVMTIEVFTFSPMLGSGGTYLGFTTGNLTNLKVPAAMNAVRAQDVEMGTEKGDVLSTIAIASSSIITTLILMLGALLLFPLTPILESDVLKPAFDNIIPALFGALGIVYVSRAWKIAITPILLMMIIFFTVPGAASIYGVFIPVGCAVSVGMARYLYKKGQL